MSNSSNNIIKLDSFDDNTIKAFYDEIYRRHVESLNLYKTSEPQITNFKVIYIIYKRSKQLEQHKEKKLYTYFDY